MSLAYQSVMGLELFLDNSIELTHKHLIFFFLKNHLTHGVEMVKIIINKGNITIHRKQDAGGCGWDSSNNTDKWF